MNAEVNLLCYPNFNPNDLEGIKHSLLLADRVHVVAPTMTPAARIRPTQAAGAKADIRDLHKSGALKGVPKGLVHLIDDYQIARLHGKEFQHALEEDLEDQDLDKWEKKWTRILGQRAWLVSPDYFSVFLGFEVEPHYDIKEIDHPEHGKLLELPFRVGMSFGLSEALWASVDSGSSLFTIEPASEEFLRLRLKRGWRHLATGDELRLDRRIEKDFAEKFATNQLGSRALEIKVPDLLKRLKDMRIEEAIELRERPETKEALSDYRRGIAEIVTSEELWRIKTIADFEEAIESVVDQKIKPSFEALGEKRQFVKDLVQVFDLKDIASQTIKSVPKLIVTSAAATTVAGLTIPLIGGAAVSLAVPALVGLACGLTASAVERLLDKWQERKEELRAVQFLTYPLRVREALVDP